MKSAALLAWYDANKRVMPWRGSRDPYAIWLSEIMLQQTTVATVTPRWRRFLERWPTVRDLAAAPLDDVLHEWTGLGYYARARNLHKAAQHVAQHLDGTLPNSFEGWRALPGVGDYTAAAVASIAHGEAVAVLDANVERVLARVLALAHNARSTEGKRALRAAAGELLDRARPGDSNQAMMELGALVCLPRAPRCDACPLAPQCRAFALATPEKFPQLPAKAPMEAVSEGAALLQRGGAVLLVRRLGAGSFQGMWELPRAAAGPGETTSAAAARALADATGLRGTTEPEPALVIRHTVMRRRIVLHVHAARARGVKPRPAEGCEARWVPVAEWQALPKSTTQAKIARWLLDAERLP